MIKVSAGSVSRKKLNVVFALVIVLLVAGGVVATHAFGESVDARSAVIHDANGKEYVMPLSKDAVLEVSTDAGRNTIQVKNGEVQVSDADCPNHDCVNRGAISKAGQQIVCLPHKLTVDISSKDASAEYDVMGS